MSSVPPQYLRDASGFMGFADEVLVPANEAEVVAFLQRATEQRTPITVAGAGSGLTGARVPKGGSVLSLEKFRELEIRDGYARVGPAVTLREIRDAAATTRQFFAPDPTEFMAPVGGAIATNASGSRSFRYGSTRRHVRALRVALMDGTVREYVRGDKVNFAVPLVPIPATRKNIAGYRLAPDMDWVDLFCGSEGTLGVILEAEISLLPIPRNLFAGVVFLPSNEHALAAVDTWRPYPELCMLEYVDRNSLQLIASRYPEIPSEASAALLIEAEDADVELWASRLLSAGALLEASWFATEPRDLERFRAFRHALPEAVIDTVVRRHVHVNMLPGDTAEAEVANDLLQEFARHAVLLGPTISAEHGLGKRKAKLLPSQYTPEQIAAMKDVKQRLDPHWLLGRGTIFA